MNLTFLNHASHIVECEEFVFITDPWLEGSAFNDGWKLLDQSTSNAAIINRLKLHNKQIFVWYSHEHSDHFAVPFLKQAKASNLNLHVLFQTTSDRRVVSFLKKENIQVSILRNGERHTLGHDSCFRVWSWRSGDSFSVLDLNGFRILNLNDCIVSDDQDSLRVKELVGGGRDVPINLLFTQFGYASWCGNEDDSSRRMAEAQEKCERIASQISVIKPEATVLFASFAYFSHADNFYLNDQQNTPATVRESAALAQHSKRIFFMKPNDRISLNGSCLESLSGSTVTAERHWQALCAAVAADSPNDVAVVSQQSIELAFRKYKKRVSMNFLFLFSIAESCRYIRPLRIRIENLGVVAQLSYVHSIRFDSDVHNFDLTMKGDVLLFTIERDYGFDSTSVNGRFRARDDASYVKAMYFFGPQNLLKNGFGAKAPLMTIKELYRLRRRM